MHEYGLIEAVIAQVLETSHDHGDAPVARIRVEVGEIAGLSSESLETAFEALRRGTPLEGTVLEVLRVPSRVACESCGFQGTASDVDLEEVHGPPTPYCPSCGYPLLVTEGAGLILREIALDAPPSGNEPRGPGRR